MNPKQTASAAIASAAAKLEFGFLNSTGASAFGRRWNILNEERTYTGMLENTRERDARGSAFEEALELQQVLVQIVDVAQLV
jgi:hypothetical protein